MLFRSKAGVERVMLGSDAPFPIGDPEPRKVVEAANFTPAQRKMIYTDTAKSLFKLRADAAAATWTRFPPRTSSRCAT